MIDKTQHGKLTIEQQEFNPTKNRIKPSIDWLAIQSKATCLPVVCCFSELAQ
jgi:hypothetical protein